MKYATFFVTLSAVGVIVFVGIFAAAWMSAADPGVKGGETSLVRPPTPERPLETTSIPTSNSPLTTEAPEESPSSTTDEVTSISSTTQSSFTNTIEEEDIDDTSTLNPSTEESEETKSEPQSFKGRMAPKDVSVDPLSDCTLTILNDTKGDIKPEYVNEDSCQQWLVQYEEGYSVDITVDRMDLDIDSKDYVLITTDQSTVKDEDNPIFAWTLTDKRYYKIPYKGTAFILFVSTHKPESDKNGLGFRIIYQQSGELTTTPASTTVGSVPTPPPNNEESIIVTAEFENEVSSQITHFRTIIANRAIKFCTEKNITRNTEITYQNVYLSDQTGCIHTWPNSAKCFSFVMAIPVDTKKSNGYELTKVNLQEMWDDWDGSEFVGIKKTDGPNYKKHVIIWFLLCVALIACFSGFLLFLWTWQVKNSYKPEENKPKMSAPIEVPPLFDYLDARLDDPECLPYYDSMYHMGTETSTDDRFSYGALPPYSQRPSNFRSSTFHFTGSNNTGIDNNAFYPEEDDEEEYEIMNKNSLTKEAKKMNEEENKTIELKDENNISENQETNMTEHV